jgi:hypothetical protein
MGNFSRIAWKSLSKRNWVESRGRVSEEGQYVNNTREEGERRKVKDKDGSVIASQRGEGH